MLDGHDVAVFWATGCGKSLVYQLPALVSGLTVFVVSPLISLMQDQVIKLNHVVGGGQKTVATFLGTAQYDPSAEARAFAGEIPLVYLTPEKLMGGSCIERLAQLEASRRLLCVAIDEAHLFAMHGRSFRESIRVLAEVFFHPLFATDAVTRPLFLAMTATMTARLLLDFSKLTHVDWSLERHQL